MKQNLFLDIDNTAIKTNEIMASVYYHLSGVKPKQLITYEWNMKDCFEPHELDKELVHKIFEVREFFDLVKPYEGCVEILERLLPYYNICPVSVGTKKNLELKREYLPRWFPFIPQENYILLEQHGKHELIDKSCCRDAVIIDDTLSALKSSVNCLKILFRYKNKPYAWQNGYEDLLRTADIHHIAYLWDEDLFTKLVNYAVRKQIYK